MKCLIVSVLPILLLSCTSRVKFIKTGDYRIDLKSLVDSYRIEENIPGMGLLYYSKNTNKIIITSGMAELATGQQITANTVYDIGSTTKVFVSLIILQLIEENKISLDSKLGLYTEIKPEYSDITIVELLTHTSGIPDYISNPSKDLLEAYEPNSDKVLSYSLLLQSSLDKKSTSKRGEWNYSNTNYLLLGKIIEEISGNTLGFELRNRIFEPNNMENTYYMPERKMITIENIATGYQLGNPMSNDKFYYSYNSAGGIISTLEDMYKFADYLLSNQEINQELRSYATDCLIETTMKTQYGLGIIISEDVMNQPMFGHGGTSFGFKSEWWLSPNTGEILIFYGNSSMYKKNFFRFRKELADILHKE